MSTIALIIGLIVANILRPGAGLNVDPSTLDPSARAAPMLAFIDALAEALFRIVGFIMRIAPIGAFGALTNVIGNGVARLVVAKWTGELDTVKMRRELENCGTVEELR